MLTEIFTLLAALHSQGSAGEVWTLFLGAGGILLWQFTRRRR